MYNFGKGGGKYIFEYPNINSISKAGSDSIIHGDNARELQGVFYKP